MSCPSLGTVEDSDWIFHRTAHHSLRGCFETSAEEKQADRKETGLAVGAGVFNEPIHSALINPLESSQGSPGESCSSVIQGGVSETDWLGFLGCWGATGVIGQKCPPAPPPRVQLR